MSAKNTAEFVLTVTEANLGRVARKLVRHLLAEDPTTSSDALFMLKEFARRPLRTLTLDYLIRTWVTPRCSQQERVLIVLRSIGQDAIDRLHLALIRGKLPENARLLIELLAAIRPQDEHEALLMWELTGHPGADERVRQAARTAYLQMKEPSLS